VSHELSERVARQLLRQGLENEISGCFFNILCHERDCLI
jgi:hypothetical protein